MQGGAVDQGKAGGDDQVHARRQLQHRVARGNHLFGVGADRHDGGDRVADLYMLHFLAHGQDRAGHFGAGSERRRRLHLVLALDDQRVGEIDAGALDGDAHLARAHVRFLDFLEYQLLGWAQFAADDSLHRSSSFVLSGSPRRAAPHHTTRAGTGASGEPPRPREVD